METVPINAAPLIDKVAGDSTLSAFMLLVMLALFLLCLKLIKRNETLNDNLLAAYIKNTEVMVQFKEELRDANSKKN